MRINSFNFFPIYSTNEPLIESKSLSLKLEVSSSPIPPVSVPSQSVSSTSTGIKQEDGSAPLPIPKVYSSWIYKALNVSLPGLEPNIHTGSSIQGIASYIYFTLVKNVNVN